MEDVDSDIKFEIKIIGSNNNKGNFRKKIEINETEEICHGMWDDYNAMLNE